MRLGTTCSLPPRPWSSAAAAAETASARPVAAVGYRPADDLLAEARQREEAVGLRGREVEVDGAVLLLSLVGRAGARDVDLGADARVGERADPFAGLVRVDEVDDGFACDSLACDVEPRLERRLTAHASHSAMFAAHVVGAGLGGDGL